MRLQPFFLAFALGYIVATAAMAQPTTSPTQPAALTDSKPEALTATITGVEGIVQVREGEDKPWKRAEVGMDLGQGAEFRTGPRSAVRFVIPPGHTITLDRLGTVKLVQAVRNANKVKTELGMKYGRTRYDVEAAGLDHDASIHSPGATLAIRGTKVSLYDQPPFSPEARSLVGRALFGNTKSKVPFGKNRPTRVDKNDGTPAKTAQVSTKVDGLSSFGRTNTEDQLLLSLVGYGGNDFRALGVLAFLQAARRGQFEGSVIGSAPVGKELDFTLFWTGSPGSVVDLSIISPKGETLNKNTPNHSVPSGGVFNPSPADPNGNGTIVSASWATSFPKGSYKVQVDLVNPGTADFNLTVKKDPFGAGTVLYTTPGDSGTMHLDASTPSFTTTIKAKH